MNGIFRFDLDNPCKGLHRRNLNYLKREGSKFRDGFFKDNEEKYKLLL